MKLKNIVLSVKISVKDPNGNIQRRTARARHRGDCCCDGLRVAAVCRPESFRTVHHLVDSRMLVSLIFAFHDNSIGSAHAHVTLGLCVREISGAPKQFHEIDERNQREGPREHRDDRVQEAQSEIARERSENHGVCPVRPGLRLAMRSIAFAMLVTNAGTSRMTPREIVKYPNTNAANSPR